MHWVWWQWALAIMGGAAAFLVALVVIAMVLLIILITANDAQERARAKKSMAYATVIEKPEPALSFASVSISDDLSPLSFYPWELGEPDYYELVLRIHYPDSYDPDDDDPHMEALNFTAIVSREIYEEAVVGGRIKNPLYEEPTLDRGYATEPV